MRRNLYILFTFVLVFQICFISLISACSCVQTSLYEEINGSNNIIVFNVIEGKKDISGEQDILKINILEVLKGSMKTGVIEVRGLLNENVICCICQFGYEVGQTYIAEGDFIGSNFALATYFCGNLIYQLSSSDYKSDNYYQDITYELSKHLDKKLLIEASDSIIKFMLKNIGFSRYFTVDEIKKISLTYEIGCGLTCNTAGVIYIKYFNSNDKQGLYVFYSDKDDVYKHIDEIEDKYFKKFPEYKERELIALIKASAILPSEYHDDQCCDIPYKQLDVRYNSNISTFKFSFIDELDFVASEYVNDILSTLLVQD